MSQKIDAVPFAPDASDNIMGVWFKAHPRMRTVWVLKASVMGFITFLFFGGWAVMAILLDENGFQTQNLLMFVLVIVMALALIFALVALWASLFYNRYLFMFDSHGIHINRGIMWKRNADIPYGRVQHVTITRGPLEQLMGLHALNIFTAGTGSVGAGFGGVGGMMAAEGFIPGLKDPLMLKNLVLTHVDMKKGSGLGYDDAVETSGKTSQSVESEMLEELRAIRKILEDK